MARLRRLGLGTIANIAQSRDGHEPIRSRTQIRSNYDIYGRFLAGSRKSVNAKDVDPTFSDGFI